MDNNNRLCTSRLIISMCCSALSFVFLSVTCYAQQPVRPDSGRISPHVGISAALKNISPIIERLDDDEEALIVQKLKAQPLLKKGAFTTEFMNKTVPVGEKKHTTLGNIVRTVFKEQDDFSADLRKIHPSSGILLKAPEVIEEIYEFPDSYVILKSTSINVSKPKELAASSALFRSYLIQAKKAKINTTSDLKMDKQESQKGFDHFMTHVVPTLAADDPLRIAAAGGRQEVLKAISEGKGTFDIIDKITIPKQPVRKLNTRMIHLIHSGPDAQVQAEAIQTPRIEESGEYIFKTKFLAGFTKDGVWEWERRWRFPSGFFRISLWASYGLGCRIPIEVQGKLYPTRINMYDYHDGAGELKLDISAYAMDAGTEFYKDVGLPGSSLHEGHEGVLEFEFGFGLRFRALWSNIVYIPKHTLMQKSFSQDFIPPMGDSGDGPRIEIPTDYTNTNFDRLDFIGGYAQIGFRLTGNGQVSLDYVPFLGSEEMPKKKLLLHKPLRTKERDVIYEQEEKTLLPAKSTKTEEKKFGFTLNNPKYEIDLSIIPEIKIGVHVGYDWLSRSFNSGWMPLNDLKLEFGSVAFTRHSGTRKEFKFKEGVKKFVKIPKYEGYIGDLVALQWDVNKKYVRGGVTDDRVKGASFLSATENDINIWETFRIKTLGNGNVAFESLRNGKYIRACITDKCYPSVESNHAQSWETFKMISLGGNKVAFQAINNGKYMRILPDKGNILATDSDRVGRNETFNLHPVSMMPVSPREDEAPRNHDSANLDQAGDNIITLRSEYRNRFVRAGISHAGNSINRVAALSEQADIWERFVVVKLNDNMIALQCLAGKKYVRAGAGDNSYLTAQSERIGAWEKFKMIKLGNNKVALQSVQSRKYVRAGFEGSGLLTANSDRIGEMETFTVPRDYYRNLP